MEAVTTVYVLGAGASKHAGYPLASEMGAELFAWMKNQANSVLNYPAVRELLGKTFGQCDNIEYLFTQMQQLVDDGTPVAESSEGRSGPCGDMKRALAQRQHAIQDHENGIQDQGILRVYVRRHRSDLANAVRDWFTEIRVTHMARSYACFANHVIEPGDCILTFNYDASLERELKQAGKWHIGDGYGFAVKGFPKESPVKLLKLHGSAGWLALASGLPTTGSGNVSTVYPHRRPAIASSELEFLGYPDVSDPMFTVSSPAAPVLIMPASKKEFFFETGGGHEWGWFWDDLWNRATDVLRRADRVVVCGYSMLPVDERAYDMLLGAPSKSAEIVVTSGKNRTREIVDEYQSRGYTGAVPSEECYFEDWVGRCRLSIERNRQ